MGCGVPTALGNPFVVSRQREAEVLLLVSLSFESVQDFELENSPISCLVAASTPGVHVIDVPTDYSDNDRILNHAIREKGKYVLRSLSVLKSTYPFYLANEPVSPNCDLEVTDKYTGEFATRVALADAKTIDHAIGSAVHAADLMRRMPPYERQAVLQHCITRFTERSEELAMSLCIEAGKPIKDCRGEVSRLVDTFRIAAEESVRIGGEVMNLEISPRARGYRGMYKE